MEWKATATVNAPFTCNILPIRLIPLIFAGLIAGLFSPPAALAFDLAWNANINNTKVRFFDLDGSGKLGAVMPNGNGVEYRLQASPINKSVPFGHLWLFYGGRHHRITGI